MGLVLRYSADEAEQMIKEYFPNDWNKKIDNCKLHLKRLADTHRITLKKAYTKFIIPMAQETDAIVFFVALAQLQRIERMSKSEKADLINKLEEQRKTTADQIVALESSNTISYDEKKIIRSYYNKRQAEATSQINELLNSFEVVDAQLIIHQPGLFDNTKNS